MKTIKNYLIIIVALITACSPSGVSFDGPDMKLKRNISDGCILVREFEVDVKNLPDVSNEKLSRRLYDLLYVNTNLHVINEESLTDSTDVGYVLNGSLVHSTSGLNFDTESAHKLTMTLRINSPADKEIVGIITATCSFKSGAKQRIDELLEMCVDEMKGIR